MNNRYVFLIGHKSGVGKDEFAKYLTANYNYNSISFAQKLKSIVYDLYGFNHEQMYGNLKNVPDERYPNTIDNNENGGDINSFTPRRILQIFGQQQRSISKEVWSSYVAKSILENSKLVNSRWGGYCIPDFRFESEYDNVLSILKDTNLIVKTVLINRDTNKNFIGSNDISETALDNWDKWDYIIDNNSDLNSFHLKINYLMNSLGIYLK